MRNNHISKMFSSSAIVALLLTLNSCANLSFSLLNETAADHTQTTAELNFLNGELEQALLEYEQIYNTAPSAESKNAALYGLACTQMILAKDDEQLIEAITKLQRWNANKGSDNFTENRNLLILALRQQRERLKLKKQQDAVHNNHQQEIIYGQKKKISQMAQTVNTLKEQLDELEEIDRTIQEKRTP